MTHEYWEKAPNSFGEIVELVERYIQAEIVQEAKNKQLYYHNLNHAIAVKRRANFIFQAIRPVLASTHSLEELSRLESLINICGLAHDMVQIFEPNMPNYPRIRLAGTSETATANRLLSYIQNINQAVVNENLDPALLFSDHEQQIIRDGIIATICIPDPEKNRTQTTWSSYSIYQPYLYDSQTKISIVGSIVALADLGALGMDGAEAHIQDGILVFLEDNPHLLELVLDCNDLNTSRQNIIEVKLLTMARFIVDLAQERQARFEQEITGFIPEMRQILRDQVFVYLNQKSINQVQSLVPHQLDASLSELINFFSTD